MSNAATETETPALEPITAERGRKVLRAEELAMLDAIECPDLVADITVKRSKELNKLTRRKRANWPERTAERSAEASKHFGAFAKACNPETTYALLVRLMVARVERDELARALTDFAGEIASSEVSARAEQAQKLLKTVEVMREKGQWDRR
jgi:hypothetical protein